MWKMLKGNENGGFSSMEMEYIRRHHTQEAGENQCSSALVKHIKAPLPLVANLPFHFFFFSFLLTLLFFWDQFSFFVF